MEGLEVKEVEVTSEVAHYAVSGEYHGVEFDVLLEVTSYENLGHRTVSGEFGDWYGDPPENSDEVEKTLVAEIVRQFEKGEIR